MRTKRTEKTNLMNRFARIGLVLVLTMAVSAIMPQGWYQPQEAQAAISSVTGWTVINDTNPNTLTPNVTSASNFTAGGTPGTNRIMLVGVVFSTTTTGVTMTGALNSITATYGGQAVTRLIGGDNGSTAARGVIWLGYIQDANIPTGANAVTVTGTVSGTNVTDLKIFCATFSGVDQTTPFTDQKWSQTTAAAATGTAVSFNYNANDFPVVFTYGNTASNTLNATTPYTPAKYTTAASSSTTLGSAFAGNITTTPPSNISAESTNVTYTNTSRIGLIAASMKVYVVTGDQVNVADGTDPASYTAYPNNTNQAADSFTMSTNANTAVVTGVTAAVTNSSNISGIRLYADNGTAGVYDNGVDILLATGTPGASVSFTGLNENISVSPGTNYLIVVDIASGAAPASTTEVTVSSIAVSSPDSQGTIADAAPTTITIGTSVPNQLSSCSSCHGYKTSFSDGSARNNPDGQFPGSHNQHVVTQAIDCSTCHTVPASETSSDFKHRNGYINMANPIKGGTYSSAPSYSFAQSNTVNPGTCNNVYCHSTVQGANGTGAGTDKPQTWGSATSLVCSSCHNDMSGASGTGSHVTHASGGTNYSYACSTCHTSYTSSSVNTALHVNDTIDVSPSPGSYSGGTTAGNHAPQGGYGRCSSTYCHSNGTSVISGTVISQNSPTWGQSTDCGSCHGTTAGDGRPNYTNNTTKRNTHGNGTDYGLSHMAEPCTTCHVGVAGSAGAYSISDTTTHNNGAYDLITTLGYSQSTGSCASPGCHGGATWGGPAMGCTQCHAGQVSSPIAASLGGPSTRPDVVTPFGYASRHIRSRTASPAVTDSDCGVCHMEGTASTGAINATYHRNGYIELRDPDLGTTIKGVTHSGTTSAAGAYSSTTTDARPVRFSRNLGSATLEADTQAIMVNLCLKCHDSGGAASSLAVVPGGTAGQPFGAAIAANPSSNVLDVQSQFASTNRAFHPILAKNNAGYTNTGSTRMVAPWNGVAKSATTTVYGPLITCWDCHAPNSVSSSVTLTTSGVHGGTPNGTDAVPLRGNVYTNSTTVTNATNLCINCHVVSGGTSNHGTGSAVTSNTNTSMTYFQNRCYYCHSSTDTTAKPARPTPSGDVHGYNTRPDGTAFATAGNGYVFIRRASLPQVVRSVGATTYAATCGTATGICSRSMGTYSPGGVY